MEEFKIAKRVSIITIIWNVLLGIIKILAGLIGHSSAMIADGFHTASDVITTIIVMIGVRISNKAADTEHPYGHEKFEPVFAKLVSLFLIFVGLGLGMTGIKKLLSGDFSEPGTIAIFAAILSIVVKEGMYWYTVKAADKIQSLSMKADAWHHRSDALSSIGTLIGISGAALSPKLRFLDPLAAVVVSILVIKVGVDLYMQSTKQLVDNAAPDEEIQKIREIACQVPGCLGINDLKTRVFGNRIYVDLEIFIDGSITVIEGHAIATAVHDAIETNLTNVKHCMVHMEPQTTHI